MIFKIPIIIAIIIFTYWLWCKSFEKPFFQKKPKLKLMKKPKEKSNINAIVKGYENKSTEQKQEDYINAIWEEILKK